MKEYWKLLAGILLVALGVAGIWYFREEVRTVILGIIAMVALLIGAIFLMIGIKDIKEKLEVKSKSIEEEKKRKKGSEKHGEH